MYHTRVFKDYNCLFLFLINLFFLALVVLIIGGAHEFCRSSLYFSCRDLHVDFLFHLIFRFLLTCALVEFECNKPNIKTNFILPFYNIHHARIQKYSKITEMEFLVNTSFPSIKSTLSSVLVLCRSSRSTPVYSQRIKMILNLTILSFFVLKSQNASSW